jgi:hypothetical protein
VEPTSTPTTPLPTTPPPQATSSSLPLLDLLPSHTLKAIDNSSSPQHIAYIWLLNHPEAYIMSEEQKLQLFSLVTFYYAFDSDTWPEQRSRANWMSYDLSECYWGGLECPSYDNVPFSPTNSSIAEISLSDFLEDDYNYSLLATMPREIAFYHLCLALSFHTWV